VAAAEDERRRHPQPAARRPRLARGLRHRLLVVVQEAPRLRREAPSRLGGVHLARGAFEQPHAEPLLQRGEGARHGGRRLAQAAAGGGEAAGLGDGRDQAQFLQPVHCSPWGKRPLPHQRILASRGKA
jgi:hypothetical protein